MRRNAKYHSLKYRLTVIVLLCWVIPLIVLGGIVAFTFFGRIQPRVMDSYVHQAGVIVSLIAERIDRCMDMSKSVTYEGFIEQVYNEALTWTADQRSPNTDPLFHRCTDYLASRFSYRSEILMAYLYFPDPPGDLQRTIYISHKTDYARMQHYEKYRYAYLDSIAGQIGTRPEIIGIDNEIFLVRNLMSSVDGARFATLVLQIEPTAILEPNLEAGIWQGRQALWFNGRIGYTGHNLTESEALENAKDIATWQTGQPQAKLQRDDIRFVGLHESDGYELSYMMMFSREAFNSDIRFVVITLLALLLVTIPLMVFNQLYVQRHIVRPVNQLISATKNVASGQLGVRVQLAANDELGALVRSFNTMSTELQYLVQFVYKEELALKDARFASLQSQINPHFLNNTLEYVNWQARIHGDEVISRIIESLSLLLNTSMIRSGERMVTIREEMKLADAYLYIIKQRLGDRLTIETDIDEDVLERYVPPMILQPLLENAVVHGIEPLREGTLRIDVRVRDDRLCLHIENDGKPITEAQMERIRAILRGDAPTGDGRRSLGLRNVNERLQLMYGDAYSLTIRIGDNGRTWTDVRIPLRTPEEGNANDPRDTEFPST